MSCSKEKDVLEIGSKIFKSNRMSDEQIEQLAKNTSINAKWKFEEAESYLEYRVCNIQAPSMIKKYRSTY